MGIWDQPTDSHREKQTEQVWVLQCQTPNLTLDIQD
jgi:hypothetical protein